MPGVVGRRSARREARRALDRRFDDLRPLVPKAVAPKDGWVRAIREALGMSAADLAARIGTAETAVLSLERNERSDRVRLDTLRRAATALDCDFVYALVPRLSLTETVENRALEVAASQLRAVDHSMRLESQGVSDAVLRDHLAEQAEILLDRPGLWRDE
jgi:predicted DNA-binding mobile mystery protein A